MKFFIDTANLEQIRQAQNMGILDGVTTNPSLMAKEGVKGKEQIFNHYRQICSIVDGPVSAEVFATDYEGMIGGDGNIDRYGAWVYSTWLGDEGDYWDVVGKFGHLENDFEIYARSTGERIKGDYDNNVFSLSLEYGKKFVNAKSWYVEPQVQAQYAYVTSAEYQTSQKTDVRLDAIHSVIARAGLRVGKDFTTENPATVYVRGDVMHEFLGDQDIRAADATGTLRERYENTGTWYSAGAGVTNKTSKDVHLFVEAEKVFGNSNRGSYTVSGGLKYFF